MRLFRWKPVVSTFYCKKRCSILSNTHRFSFERFPRNNIHEQRNWNRPILRVSCIIWPTCVSLIHRDINQCDGQTLSVRLWSCSNDVSWMLNWMTPIELSIMKKVMQKHVMNCNKMVNHGCMLVHVLFGKSYILIWLKDILEGQKLII